jgi:HAD domain in Swiss Army Knife RNA repair proteins
MTTTSTIDTLGESTSPRSYLFLDVDGVLNPEAVVLPGDWRQTQVDRYWVWTSIRLGQWLSSLADRGIQIVWATTWIEHPAALAALAAAFDLPPDLPRIDRLEWLDDDGWDSGKRPGVQRWLEDHGIDPSATPVVWVDDDLGPNDLRWAGDAGVRALRIPSSHGLADPGQRVRIESALDAIVGAGSSTPRA